MHSAVMQNKKYIEFAKENCVDVLVEQRVDEAVQKKDPKAVAYKTKGPDGKEAIYMLEWPNLTLEEILALCRSPAGQYNNTGKIPYTSLVDPWTLKEIEKLGTSAKGIMDSVETARKSLVKEHGKGIARKDLDRLSDAEGKVAQLVAAKDYAKADETLDKATGKEVPEGLKARVDKARESITTAAQKEIEALEELSRSDPAKAKKELPTLLNRLRGTGLEDKVKELMKSLASGN